VYSVLEWWLCTILFLAMGRKSAPGAWLAREQRSKRREVEKQQGGAGPITPDYPAWVLSCRVLVNFC
jgi:hypothetical protein